MSEAKIIINCSFCRKPSTDVKKVIAGPDDIYICDECIDLCYEEAHKTDQDRKRIVEAEPEGVVEKKLPKPVEINEHLCQFIIGQKDALKSISVAVYDHYKRVRNPIVDDVELEKSNILLVGPTGSGKTLIAKSIAKMLDVPFAIADATALTEAGYVGDDVESIITRLLQAADNDVSKAEGGIIYLDEIDKKARRGETASGSRDVSGEGVQQALLKIIEGTDVMVPSQGGRKGPNHDLVKVNTRNILFILGGAFVGIEKMVEKDLNKSSSIGFGATKIGREKDDLNALFSKIEADHLTKYGLIPELVGRLPVICVLHELTEDQLVQVMTETKNAVTRQFQKLFQLDGVVLEFDLSSLRVIAKIAQDRKTGARGLRSVIEKHLLQTKYDLPTLSENGLAKVVVAASEDGTKLETNLIYNAMITPAPLLAIASS